MFVNFLSPLTQLHKNHIYTMDRRNSYLLFSFQSNTRNSRSVDKNCRNGPIWPSQVLDSVAVYQPVGGCNADTPSHDRPRSHHQTLIQPSSPAQPGLPAAPQMECFALNINYKAYNLIRCWVSVAVNLGSRHYTLLGQFVMRTPARPGRPAWNTNTPANSNQVTTCPLW